MKYFLIVSRKYTSTVSYRVSYFSKTSSIIIFLIIIHTKCLYIRPFLTVHGVEHPLGAVVSVAL